LIIINVPVTMKIMNRQSYDIQSESTLLLKYLNLSAIHQVESEQMNCVQSSHQ